MHSVSLVDEYTVVPELNPTDDRPGPDAHPAVAPPVLVNVPALEATGVDTDDTVVVAVVVGAVVSLSTTPVLVLVTTVRTLVDTMFWTVVVLVSLVAERSCCWIDMV